MKKILICIFLLASVSSFGANRFEGKELVNCCVIENRDLCPESVKNGKEKGCITEEESQTLLERNAMLTCVGTKLVGACKCSCFASSTKLLVKERLTGREEWVTLADLLKTSSLYEVRTESPMGHASFHVSTCKPTIVLVLHMEDGSVLKVTPEHPVFSSSKEMVMAEKLSSGDFLTSPSGHMISIQRITKEETKTSVLNVVIESDSEEGHTIVADGFLVGDAAWQRVLVRQLHD